MYGIGVTLSPSGRSPSLPCTSPPPCKSGIATCSARTHHRPLNRLARQIRTHSASSGYAPPSTFRPPHSAFRTSSSTTTHATTRLGSRQPDTSPIGGDHGDYSGFDSALSSLHSEVNSFKPNSTRTTHHAPRSSFFTTALGLALSILSLRRGADWRSRGCAGIPTASTWRITPAKRPICQIFDRASWSPARDLEFHCAAAGCNSKSWRRMAILHSLRSCIRRNPSARGAFLACAASSQL